MSVTLSQLAEEPVEDRKSLVEQVRLYGHSCVDAVLDPLTKIFQVPDIEGLIGYRVELSRAIVYGDPVCRWEDVPALIKAFHAYCKQQEIKNVIYLISSEKFTKWAMQEACSASIEFGQELTLDPHEDPKAKTGVYASLVRRKVRHAIKEGVEVREYTSSNDRLEESLEQVGDAWLKSRKGLQIHISHLHLFKNRFGKRWFYAQQGKQVVGVIVLNWLESKKGWLINHLVFTPEAPNGTPELLLTTVLDELVKENCRYVTFGAVPSSQLGEMGGFKSLSVWLARGAYRLINYLFHLDGKKKFWEKFDPQGEPAYLVFEKAAIAPNDIWALLLALNVFSRK